MIVGEERASMNPYDEKWVRDEVIYLHSLWHQGPPQQPNPYHRIPSSSSSQSQPLLHRHSFAPSHTRSLLPVTSTAFKKSKNHNRKKKKGPEWPCLHSSDSPKTGWPVPKTQSDPHPPLQPREKERLSAVQAQNKACKAFREFLSGSSSHSDNEEEDDEEDDDDRLVEFEEFFIRVFMGDNELMGYYQSCFENGDFCCLVCGAAEKKSWKKYKDCVGLVQHSISILRTANKKAHRAFGQAVCMVLGWDIHRLPTIVITAEPLRCSTQGNPEKNVAADDDGKDGSSKTEDIAVSLEHVEDSVEEHVKGADQSIGDCSSQENDIDAKVVSLAHVDEPVEDHERGVDQSNSEVINLQYQVYLSGKRRK